MGSLHADSMRMQAAPPLSVTASFMLLSTAHSWTTLSQTQYGMQVADAQALQHGTFNGTYYKASRMPYTCVHPCTRAHVATCMPHPPFGACMRA
jgi:hypothetical protein